MIQGPTNLPAYFSGDADFRTFVAGVHAALGAIGLVQTADTGQINPATVARPGGANTPAGFEIWRFDDAHQADAPVFIKLEYGTGGAADRASLWGSVGSGTNGSGTLTGQVSTRIQLTGSASKTAGVLLPTCISGDNGELLLAFNLDFASYGFGSLFGVERPKDSSDARTGEGVLVTWQIGNGSSSSQFVPATGGVPASQGQHCVVAPNFWARSAAGAYADVVPVFIPLGGVWRFSHICATGLGDWVGGGTMAVPILGGSHTYFALDRSICYGSGTSFTGSTGSGAAIRWE